MLVFHFITSSEHFSSSSTILMDKYIIPSSGANKERRITTVFVDNIVVTPKSPTPSQNETVSVLHETKPVSLHVKGSKD